MSDPSFDLVVATVDRTDDLAALLDCLASQTYSSFRVLLVDQNSDDRIAPLIEAADGIEITRLRSPRGLSRARNVALGELTGDLVAFPDDDCLYPPDFLARVASRFVADPNLQGVSGRAEDRSGQVVGRWPGASTRIDWDNVWHTATSHTIFLRRELVEQIGSFDESMGLGSGSAWSSGEEIDYLVRGLRLGARIDFDPSLVVTHPVKPTTPSELVAFGRRDGEGVGYLLARNAAPGRRVGWMLIRPAVGAVVSLVLLDRKRARFHAATFAGRVHGYAAGRRRGVRPVG